MSGEETRPPTRLSDLIKTANRTKTLDELAERAIDPETGTRLRRSVLSKISRGGVLTMPPPGHIGALAAALGLDYEIVRRAALLQYMPPRDKDLREVEEQSVAHMRAYGVAAVTAAVKLTYRRLDDEFKASQPELTAEQREHAGRVLEKSDKAVPRRSPRPKSA